MDRRYYLQDIPLDEASARYAAALDQSRALSPTDSERIPIQNALGRITAEPVWASRSVPHYDASAMDGIAVRSADTVGASETRPLSLTVPEQAAWVDTGDPVPDDFDAVIMIEVVRRLDDSTIEIRAPGSPLPARQAARRGHRAVRTAAARKPPPATRRPRSLRRRRSDRDERPPKARPSP